MPFRPLVAVLCLSLSWMLDLPSCLIPGSSMALDLGFLSKVGVFSLCSHVLSLGVIHGQKTLGQDRWPSLASLQGCVSTMVLSTL